MRPYKLDFIVLGSARSGTTFLDLLLRQCPSIQLPKEKKETRFFDGQDYDRGLEFYFKKYFSHDCTQCVRGEVASSYLYVPYVPARLHALNAEMKLIVLVREPLRRAISDWWMMYNSGVEDLPFEKAVEQNFERIRNGPDFSDPKAWHEHLQAIRNGKMKYRTYIDYGYYYVQIERYLSLFSSSNIMVIQFEQFITDPRFYLNRILAFLGLKNEFLHINLEKPRNTVIIPRKMHKIYNLYKKLGISSILPRNLKNYIRMKFEHSSKNYKPQIADEVMQNLQKHFRPYNRKLSSLLSTFPSENVFFDLSLWEERADGHGDRNP